MWKGVNEILFLLYSFCCEVTLIPEESTFPACQRECQECENRKLAEIKKE